VCFAIAAACWTLAFVRTTLLVVIEATSMPVLHAGYLAPAYFMLVSAAVLSVAASLQLPPFARSN
jgi:hypothetical protein